MSLVNRYGVEIEYDLQAELGMDLHDWFRARYPWDKLLRLVEQLPHWSRYKAAAADDDEMAARLLDAETDEEPRRRHLTLVDWTPERELLTSVAESVRDLHATLLAVNSKDGKRKAPPPLPRPRTAVERARRIRNEAQAADIAAIFSPKEG